jgi:hypothetical protein
MAEKFSVKDDVLSFGTCEGFRADDEPVELPHAATSSAALEARAVAATAFVTERKETTSLMGGTPRGRQVSCRALGSSRGGCQLSSSANIRLPRVNTCVNIDVTSLIIC